MNRLLALWLLLLATGTQAATITFEWTASSPSNEVAGYTIVWGTSSGNYPNSQDFGNVLVGAVTTFADNMRYYVSI
jgi:hypothetical protein